MKHFIILFLLFLNNISAIEVSFSKQKTLENKISDFARVVPADSEKCQLQTDVWLWNDGKNICFNFECEIDEKFKVGKFAENDNLIEADYIRVQLITDKNDSYSYCYYFFPLENKYDAIRDANFFMDENWNSSYLYQSEINAKNWLVFAKIPFQDLRFDGVAPHNWKMIITRYFSETKEHYSHPFVLVKMGGDYFKKATKITINNEIKHEKNIKIKPHSIISRDLEENNYAYGIGVDALYKPSNSMSLKLSIKPDFTDVPLDDETDEHNSINAPSLAENRFFFTEDVDVYGISKELFYSRNIVQPLFAFKITNSNDNYNFGLLSSKDDNDKNADVYNILAFSPKWNNSSVQLSYLNRMNEDYLSHVFHINPSWQISAYKSLWFEMNISHNYHAENWISKQFLNKGYFWKLGYSVVFDDFFVRLKMQKTSKDFDPKMGYVNLTDFSQFNVTIWKETEFENKVFNKVESSYFGNVELENETDKLLNQYQSFGIDFSTNFDIGVSANISRGREFYAENYFNQNMHSFGFKQTSFGFLQVHMTFTNGERLLYDLMETYQFKTFQLGVFGDVSKFASYSILADKTRYLNLIKSENTDDEYWVGNLDVFLNVSNNLSLKNGIRYDDFEYSGTIKHFGFFSNFHYQMKNNIDIYLGYKTSANEREKCNITDYQTFFLKIGVQF